MGRGCSPLPAIFRHGQWGGQCEQRRWWKKEGMSLRVLWFGEPCCLPTEVPGGGLLSSIFPWLPGSVGMCRLWAAIPLLCLRQGHALVPSWHP